MCFLRPPTAARQLPNLPLSAAVVAELLHHTSCILPCTVQTAFCNSPLHLCFVSIWSVKPWNLCQCVAPWVSCLCATPAATACATSGGAALRLVHSWLFLVSSSQSQALSGVMSSLLLLLLLRVANCHVAKRALAAVQGMYRPRQRGGSGAPEGEAFFFRASCFELLKCRTIRHVTVLASVLDSSTSAKCLGCMAGMWLLLQGLFDC